MKTQLIKAIDLAIENLQAKKNLSTKANEKDNIWWEIKNMEELKNYLENLSKARHMDFYRQGGSWLGTIRSWVQSRCFNGDSVSWSSQDFLKFRDITMEEVESLAQEIAAATAYEIMDHQLHFIKK